MTLSALLALALGSCAADDGPHDGGRISFGIVPAVAQAEVGGIAETRAMITGAFPSGSTIGLRLTAPSAAPAISSVYNSFHAAFNGGVWFYYLDNINAGDRLSGFSSWGTVTVYGYHPYSNLVADLGVIPFRIASMSGSTAEGTEASVATDYMVAEPRSKDMTASSGDIPLRFGHVMTAIEFEISRSLSSVAALKLKDATFRISGGSPAREFTVSGTFSALNPDMADLGASVASGETAAEMIVSYPSAPSINSSSITRMLLVMMPELRQTSAADDATVTITFRFTDQDGSLYEFEEFAGGNPSVTFNLSDVSNAGNDNGLLAGWSYAVKAVLGGYTKFSAPAAGTPHVNYDELADDPNNEFVDI